MRANGVYHIFCFLTNFLLFHSSWSRSFICARAVNIPTRSSENYVLARHGLARRHANKIVSFIFRSATMICEHISRWNFRVCERRARARYKSAISFDSICHFYFFFFFCTASRPRRISHSPCKIGERVVCIVAVGGIRCGCRCKRFVQLLRARCHRRHCRTVRFIKRIRTASMVIFVRSVASMAVGVLRWWWLIWLRLRLIDKHLIDAARTSHLAVFRYRFDTLIAALQESGHFFHHSMIHLTARFHLPFAKYGRSRKRGRERDRENWKIGILF